MQGGQAILTALQPLPDLKYLEYSQNTANPAFGAFLASLLPSFKSLEAFSVSDKVRPAAMQAIKEAVRPSLNVHFSNR